MKKEMPDNGVLTTHFWMLLFLFFASIAVTRVFSFLSDSAWCPTYACCGFYSPRDRDPGDASLYLMNLWGDLPIFLLPGWILALLLDRLYLASKGKLKSWFPNRLFLSTAITTMIAAAILMPIAINAFDKHPLYGLYNLILIPVLAYLMAAASEPVLQP